MKTFMEEYGLIVIAVVVVAALIVLAVSFSKQATDSANNAFESFNTKAENALKDAGSDTGASTSTGTSTETTGSEATK
jgi:hypothetical protein